MVDARELDARDARIRQRGGRVTQPMRTESRGGGGGGGWLWGVIRALPSNLDLPLVYVQQVLPADETDAAFVADTYRPARTMPGMTAREFRGAVCLLDEWPADNQVPVVLMLVDASNVLWATPVLPISLTPESDYVDLTPTDGFPQGA